MVIEHLVFFKFQTLTTEEEAAIFEAMNSLKSIKYVKELSFGRNFNVDRNEGYTHALRGLFETKEDLLAYSPCDEHMKVVNFIKTYFVGPTICLDFEV
jgi:hypothetical protein